MTLPSATPAISRGTGPEGLGRLVARRLALGTCLQPICAQQAAGIVRTYRPEFPAIEPASVELLAQEGKGFGQKIECLLQICKLGLGRIRQIFPHENPLSGGGDQSVENEAGDERKV